MKNKIEEINSTPAKLMYIIKENEREILGNAEQIDIGQNIEKPAMRPTRINVEKNLGSWEFAMFFIMICIHTAKIIVMMPKKRAIVLAIGTSMPPKI